MSEETKQRLKAFIELVNFKKVLVAELGNLNIYKEKVYKVKEMYERERSSK